MHHPAQPDQTPGSGENARTSFLSRERLRWIRGILTATAVSAIAVSPFFVNPPPDRPPFLEALKITLTMTGIGILAGAVIFAIARAGDRR